MRKLNVKTVKESPDLIKVFSTMSSTIEKINALSILTENINPTIIYNEGWMIRLLTIESIIEKLKIKGIDFERLATKNWSSEALVKSPFVQAKEFREGYTHADIILGDFSINYDERGEVKLNDSPEYLGIIEAKMGSNLSQGTSNAKNYNQASRNVCCLSYLTRGYPDCEIFFAVAAPKMTIEKIKNQIERDIITNQIKERFQYSKDNKYPEIKGKVEKCKVLSISYERWIEEIKDTKPPPS